MRQVPGGNNNWPGFEEVTRACREWMVDLMEALPEDVRTYAMRLSEPV